MFGDAKAEVTEVFKHRIYGIIPTLPTVGPVNVTVKFGTNEQFLDGTYHFRSLPDVPEVRIGGYLPAANSECSIDLDPTCGISVGDLKTPIRVVDE